MTSVDPTQFCSRFIEPEKLEKMGNDLIAEMLSKVDATGINCSKHVFFGDPAHRIIEFAEQEGAALIVIGSKGRTGVKKFLLGSVASKVLTYAHCTVMVIK